MKPLTINSSCRLALVVSVLIVAVLTMNLTYAEERRPGRDYRDGSILVFAKTAGWRHDSIPDAKLALLKLGEKAEINVDITENASVFRPEILASYDAVVFLSTSGELFNDEQRKAFQGYIQNGGGFVGIHAATDSEYDWPWYTKLVGAQFASHPENQYAEKEVITYDHPSTSILKGHIEGNRWRRYDEWYNFQAMNEEVTVLLNLDEKTYEGGTHGESHPIAWYHEYDGGRAFYTAGGHTRESYSEPLFLKHILGGILYAMGRNWPDND